MVVHSHPDMTTGRTIKPAVAVHRDSPSNTADAPDRHMERHAVVLPEWKYGSRSVGGLEAIPVPIYTATGVASNACQRGLAIKSAIRHPCIAVIVHRYAAWLWATGPVAPGFNCFPRIDLRDRTAATVRKPNPLKLCECSGQRQFPELSDLRVRPSFKRNSAPPHTPPVQRGLQPPQGLRTPSSAKPSQSWSTPSQTSGVGSTSPTQRPQKLPRQTARPARQTPTPSVPTAPA